MPVIYKAGNSINDCIATKDISVFVTPSGIKKCWFNFVESSKPLNYRVDTKLELFTNCSDCISLLNSQKYTKTGGFSKNPEDHFLSYLSNHYYKAVSVNNTTKYAKCANDIKRSKTQGFAFYIFKQFNE